MVFRAWFYKYGSDNSIIAYQALKINRHSEQGSRQEFDIIEGSDFMALSDNIRQRRLQLGLTMEQLASRIGTSTKAVSKFEANMAKPQPEVLLKLAKTLGTTCEQLIDGKENANERTETV